MSKNFFNDIGIFFRFAYAVIEVIFLNDCKLPITISVIACAIAENKSDDEVNILGALFNQLGDTLATIAAQRASNDSNNDNGSNCKSNNDSDSNCKSNNSNK